MRAWHPLSSGTRNPPAVKARRSPYREFLAGNSRRAYRERMEGLTHAASPRLDDYYGTHEIYQLEGNWYAWKPAPDGGELTHARTAEELADKLGG